MFQSLFKYNNTSFRRTTITTFISERYYISFSTFPNYKAVSLFTLFSFVHMLCYSHILTRFQKLKTLKRLCFFNIKKRFIVPTAFLGKFFLFLQVSLSLFGALQFHEVAVPSGYIKPIGSHIDYRRIPL